MKEIHKSSWGYHPCSRETYFKLKALNKLTYISEAQMGNWYRWRRKQPQNRVIRKKIRNENNQIIGYEIVGPAKEPSTSYFCGKSVYEGKFGAYVHLPSGKFVAYVLPGEEFVSESEEFKKVRESYKIAKHPVQNEKDVRSLLLTNKEIDGLYSTMFLERDKPI